MCMPPSKELKKAVQAIGMELWDIMSDWASQGLKLRHDPLTTHRGKYARDVLCIHSCGQ